MDEIERLELRIEELSEAITRSRRLRLAGRASAVIGPTLLIGLALGLLNYTPARMIVASRSPSAGWCSWARAGQAPRSLSVH